MPFGQSLLNKWVKVNKRNIVFPPLAEEGGKQEIQPGGDSVNSNSNTIKQHESVAIRENEVDSSVKTAGTLPSQYAETQAIRRFNNRRDRRRELDQAISAIDQEQQLKQQIGSHDQKGDSLDQSSSTHATFNQDPTNGNQSSDLFPKAQPILSRHHDDRSILSKDGTDEGSLRFVSGFFGTEITEPSQRSVDSLHHLLGSANFHHLDDSLRLHSNSATSVHPRLGPQHQLDGASVASRGGCSLPARRTSTSSYKDHLKRTDSQDSSKGGLLGILFTGDNNNNVCRQCTKFEHEMASALEDLEYLRRIALRAEYACQGCNTESSCRLYCNKGRKNENKPKALQETNQESKSLLEERTLMHKVQMKKLSSRMAEQQRDAQTKLQNFGSLCRDLNEEAAIRNEEAIELHKEIDSVRRDRDKISAELETAKAMISNYENRIKERPRIDVIVQNLESNLDEADRGIKTRDKIILDLSTRLDRALQHLENERDHQRRRRQIIFPFQQRSPSFSEGRPGEHGLIEAEVKIARQNLGESQTEMESLQHRMNKREHEWMIKLEYLERQLEASRAINSDDATK